MTALERTQRGLILGLCKHTGRARLSGFNRARMIDTQTRRFTLQDGAETAYLGASLTASDLHQRINSLAVTAGATGVINATAGCILPRPRALSGLYITECELEVDPDFASRLLTAPERYLTHLSSLNDHVTADALPQDLRTQCWHLVTGDEATEQMGFAPRSLLQMLGVRHQPLGDVTALTNWLFDDMPVGPGGLQPVQPLLPQNPTHDAILPNQLARYSADQSGQRLLMIQCPACTEKFAFPTGKYLERSLKLRCPSCASVFLGEVLRSDPDL